MSTHGYPYEVGHWTRLPSVVRAATRRFQDWFGEPISSADGDDASAPPDHRGDPDQPEDP
jgi:hypothetical protein